MEYTIFLVPVNTIIISKRLIKTNILKSKSIKYIFLLGKYFKRQLVKEVIYNVPKKKKKMGRNIS